MKRLIVFLFPPGWDASLSQGSPPALNSSVPIYTPGCRQPLLALSTLPKNTTQCPRPGLEPKPLDPESSTLTMRQPRLHRRTGNIEYIHVITRFLMTISSDNHRCRQWRRWPIRTRAYVKRGKRRMSEITMVANISVSKNRSVDVCKNANVEMRSH